ncbi:MAG: hypothetical protein ACI9G1_003540, partial [Pirellulaceae bacterium]
MKRSHLPFRNEISEEQESLDPRFVYADWLEEQGNPLGEFIRTQIALSELPQRHARCAELKSRELQLQRQYQKGWVRDLRPFVQRWEFHNGLVEGIAISAEQFLEHAAAIKSMFPIRNCRFLDTRKHLTALAESSSLAGLHNVDLSGERLGRWGEFQTYETERNLLKLLGSEHLAEVRHLGLAGNRVNGSVLKAIEEIRFQKINSIDLYRNVNITTESLGRFLSAYPIQKLRVSYTQHQDLSGDWRIQSTVAFAQQILASPSLRQIEILERGLWFGHLGSEFDSSKTAFESVSFRGNLVLGGDGGAFSPTTQRADFTHASNLLKSADSVNLSACGIDPTSCRALLQTRDWSSVVRFDLSNNPLGEEGLDLVASYSSWDELSELRISSLQPVYSGPVSFGADSYRLTDASMREFCASLAFPRLSKLELTRHQFTADTAKKIVASPWICQLYHLDLSKNQFGDDG